MNDIFHAVANLPDGRKLEIEGTVMECSNWADNVIRVNGVCEITIRRIFKAGDYKCQIG